MNVGIALISTAVDPETTANVAESLGNLEHGLTSKAELRKLLLARMKEIGVKWDAKENAYVSVSESKSAE